MRPATDLMNNPAGLVDKRIGDLYLAMETIIAMGAAVQAVADNMVPVVDVAANIGTNLRHTVISGTAPLAGASGATAHGLTQTRIRNYQVLIQSSDSLLVKPDGTDLSVTLDTTNINLTVGAGASTLSGRPFTCLLTYEHVEE